MSKCLGIILYPPPIFLWKCLVYKDCISGFYEPFGDLNLCPQLVQQVLVLAESSFHQLDIHYLLRHTALGLVGWAFQTQACPSQGQWTPASAVAVTNL